MRSEASVEAPRIKNFFLENNFTEMYYTYIHNGKYASLSPLFGGLRILADGTGGKK
jgi:hypothetical protein